MVPQGYKFFWGINCSNGVRLATLALTNTNLVNKFSYNIRYFLKTNI